jgi:hypothetical protein
MKCFQKIITLTLLSAVVFSVFSNLSSLSGFEGLKSVEGGTATAVRSDQDKDNQSDNKKLQEHPEAEEKRQTGNATELNNVKEVRHSLANNNENTSDGTFTPDKILFHFIYSGNWSNFYPSYSRAVESVLYHHPRAKVRIHTQNVKENVSIPLLEPLFKTFDLEIEHYDLAEELELLKNHLNATLVQTFIERLPTWMYTSKHRENNKSNIYRLLLLLTRGGIYLDLDCIFLKPMHDLGDNVIGKENTGQVNTAVLKFQKGSIYLKLALERMFKDFRPNKWSYNGPLLLTRTLDNDFPKCDWNKGTRRGVNASIVCPVNILSVDGFYPMAWHETDEICANSPINDTIVQERKRIIEVETYAIHLTGKKKKTPTYPGTLCRWLKNAFCVTNETCAMIA